MIEIASQLGDGSKGEVLVDSIEQRIERVTKIVSSLDSPKRRVACIEWVEPLMVAGNWMPELVELVGAIDVLGPKTIHAATIDFGQLSASDPDTIIVMLCGWGIEKAREELEPVLKSGAWDELRAVREGRIFYSDGNHFFNRPGPRLADSLEILAEIMHPKSFRYGYEGNSWARR